ncbi:hypothetical protein NKJ66_07320 [Mesorhizobium sp. M0078]|uniref:hypothetical protein n=1 Tax=Mesorhizobium sp. M0078 TaxID=2956871 RepID=UPI00333D57AA
MPNDDILGAAMAGANSPFPDLSSADAKGTKAWSDFRAKNETPQPAADAGARGGSTWTAPPAGSAPAATGAPAIGEGLPAVPAHLRASNPELVAKSLPHPGAERYLTLLDAKQESWLLANAGGDEITEYRNEIHRRQAIFNRQLADSPNETIADDSPTKIAFAEAVASRKAEIDRIEARRAPHKQRMHAIGQALNSVNKYLTYTPIASFRPATLIKPAKADSIAVVSDRIASMRVDLSDVESRPWPSADAKARAEREIDFLASKGGIAVVQSVAYRGQMAWPSVEDITLRGFGRGMSDVYDVRTVSSSTAITCWLFRDHIIAKMHAEIDAAANDPIALDAEQRGAERARLSGQLLAEERLLSALIWRDAAFHLIPADLDPRALLGLDGPAPREDW